MKTLSEIINSRVFCDEMKISSKNFMDKIVKNSTIFSFWGDIVGLKFSGFSFPYAIKNSKLFVCVKSPVIAQELSMHKDRLIKKTNAYSKPLGIEIRDIIFSYKDWEKKTESNKTQKLDTSDAVFLNKSDFCNIKLDEEFIKSVKDNINASLCLSEKQKEELVEKILSAKKAQILQQKMK